jgi:hypothetical protein
MVGSGQRCLARILFDEFHSETWPISTRKAKQIQPRNFANSSYAKAAAALSANEGETVG